VRRKADRMSGIVKGIGVCAQTVYLSRMVLVCGLFFFCLMSLLFFVQPLQASEEKLKVADGLLKEKNYLKSGQIYKEVFLSTKKGPLSERALFGLGKSEFNLKRYFEAQLHLKRLLSVYPQTVFANETYYLLAYVSAYSKKFTEAEHYFDKAGGELREKAVIGKAEIALRTGSAKKAEDLLTELNSKTRERNPRAVFLKADLFSRKGQNKEAVDTIKKISDAALKDEDLRVGKAVILFYASRFADAEALCKTIIRDSGSSLEVLNAKKTLAKLYSYTGKTDNALALYLEIFPREMEDETALNLARLYTKKGDTGNALRYLTFLKDKKARGSEMEKQLKPLVDAKDPNALEYVLKYEGYVALDSAFTVEAARYLIANGKKKEGTALMRKAYKGSGNGEDALYLAEMLINEGKSAEAKKILFPILFDRRYFYRASYLMGEISRREGDYAQAIKHMLSAAKEAGDHSIYSRLADLYWETGDRKSAQKYYIAAADSGDSGSSIKAADLYYLEGDVKKARLYYKKAMDKGIESAKDQQWTYYQYGKLAGDRDSLKKAADSGGLVGEAASVLAGAQ